MKTYLPLLLVLSWSLSFADYPTELSTGQPLTEGALGGRDLTQDVCFDPRLLESLKKTENCLSDVTSTNCASMRLAVGAGIGALIGKKLGNDRFKNSKKSFTRVRDIFGEPAFRNMAILL